MASPPPAKLDKFETYTEREDALRARGNVLYGELAAGGGGKNASDKRSKLQRAQELYMEALELSCNSEKRASCCKNLGALHYLWGRVELELLPSWTDQPAGGDERVGRRSSVPLPPPKLSACTLHLGQAISFFLRAHVEGARAQKPLDWMEQVASSLARLVKWAAKQSRVLEFPGAPILKHVCEELEKAGRNRSAFKVEAEALANLELADCLFQLNEASSSGPAAGTRRTGQAQMVVIDNGVYEEPLNRASDLLESLAPSPTTEILYQRLSSLRSDILPGLFKEMFFTNL